MKKVGFAYEDKALAEVNEVVGEIVDIPNGKSGSHPQIHNNYSQHHPHIVWNFQQINHLNHEIASWKLFANRQIFLK